MGFFLGFFPHQVWNDLEWQQLLENLPDLKSITTPLKCDKNKGLPDGMLTLCNLETLTAHSILRADHVLFRDVSRLSSLRQLCIQILCVDVLVERTEALRQLALLRDLEDLELTIRRYSLSHTCKQDFQYLLYHLVCGPFYHVEYKSEIISWKMLNITIKILFFTSSQYKTVLWCNEMSR